uniref:RalA-binding protein 1 n=1 Tax=Cacopsylla melanoneura TaxID=428564 RepID=A0A8D8TNB9_9HEMI
MEFESPDVEREFPGLYASESGSKKGNESDFSDESFDSKLSKKDLLLGKRKEKKDRGYATLDGESSPDEEVNAMADVRSPSKSKKSKPFKFSTKSKEKKEKGKEKEVKSELMVEKDKDTKKKEKDKDKSSKAKEKEKLKERKKVKSGDIGEEAPIFGVTLELSNERCPCHDGINIPLVVRDCIDHVEAHGLNTDQVYKVSGLKSKVAQLKQMYNRREPVILSHMDTPVVTSLLKLYLRELAEPLLTSELSSKFEEVAGIKDVAVRETELKRLVDKLGPVNKLTLAWLVSHLNHVSLMEKTNKMSSQALATVMGPVLQMSIKLLSALMFHCESILPHVEFRVYVPPLTCSSPGLPSTHPGIQEELKKQESLLSQLHAEMNAGFVSKQREEQLWEVQRIITQLKRKLRVLEKGSSSQRSIDESNADPEPTTVAATAAALDFNLNLSLQKVKDEAGGGISVEQNQQQSKLESGDKSDKSTKSADKSHIQKVDQKSSDAQPITTGDIKSAGIPTVDIKSAGTSIDSTKGTGADQKVSPATAGAEGGGESAHRGFVQSASLPSNHSVSPPGSIQSSSVSIQSSSDLACGADIPSLKSLSLGLDETDSQGSALSETDFILKGLKLESAELMTLATQLQEAILDEKLQIAALQQKIASHPNFNNNIDSLSVPLTCNDNADPSSDLARESMRLEIQKENLIRSIIEERETILDLKVQILMKQGVSIPV